MANCSASRFRRAFAWRLIGPLSSPLVQSRRIPVRIQRRGASSVDAIPSDKSPQPPTPTTPSSQTNPNRATWPEGEPHLPYVPTGPPTVPAPLNWKTRLLGLFTKRSAEDRAWIREELKRELKRSTLQNFREITFNKTKYYEASNVLIKPEMSNYMHNLTATALDGKRTQMLDLLRGKITLVSFAFNSFAVQNVKTFINPILEEFGHSHPNIQLVQVYVEHDVLKWPFTYSLVPYVRKTVPSELHPKYLMYYGRLPLIHRKTLNIRNNLLGYVFLVDADGRIRWTAHGDATENEKKTLITQIKELGSSLEKTAK